MITARTSGNATGPISKQENTSISGALAIWAQDQSIVGTGSLWAWIAARVKTRNARWVREFVKRAVESHLSRMHADLPHLPHRRPWPTRAAVTNATSDKIVLRTDLLHLAQALEATLLGSRIMFDYGHTGTCITIRTSLGTVAAESANYRLPIRWPGANPQFDNEAQEVLEVD